MLSSSSQCFDEAGSDPGNLLRVSNDGVPCPAGPAAASRFPRGSARRFIGPSCLLIALHTAVAPPRETEGAVRRRSRLQPPFSLGALVLLAPVVLGGLVLAHHLVVARVHL